MILALFCEAVTTGKVAVVCNVEAECFYDGRTVGKLINCVFVDVFCKEHAVVCKFLNFFSGFGDTHRLLVRGERIPYVCIFSFVHAGKDIVYAVIHNMDGAAVDVQHHVEAIAFI